jgi:hypothetical protein
VIVQIVAHTPRWVFALFVALVALGVSQLFTRQVGIRRAMLMPLAMVALSLAGIVAFAAAQPLVLLLWAAAAATVAALVGASAAPAKTSFDPATRRFSLPGSIVPLALIVGIFAVRYAVGATLALHPQLAHQAAFALPVGALYGALSGVFLGRALRLWRLAAPVTAVTA